MISKLSHLRNWFAANSCADFVAAKAFPHELAMVSRATAVRLSRGQLHPPTLDKFQVKLKSETLSIPYRVYYDKEQLLKCVGCSGPEEIVALCLGTRHFDGYVREKCVKELLLRDEYWVVPFLVQLLGEYVVEIAILIEQSLLSVDGKEYAKFLRENPKYFETLGRRAVSYWDVYYRQQYPKLNEYPAARAIALLKKLRNSDR
ncbi:MAG: hypothetical protein V4488_09720 [Pseudomonadota bacterium]